MKRQTLIVFTIAFMLLVPLSSLGIIGLSGTHTLEEQNPIRDNALAEDSTSTFSETLPNNVMYMPDSMYEPIPELSDYGEISDESYSADHVNTHVVDSVPFTEALGSDIEIWFEFPHAGGSDSGYDGFTYSHYLKKDGGTGFLSIYNFDTTTYDILHTITESGSYAWVNGSITKSDYWNETHVAFQFDDDAGTCTLDWDYGQIASFELNELSAYGEISDESYSAGHVNTHVVDSVPFTESGAVDIEIWFNFNKSNGGFTYSHYLKKDGGTGYLSAYNFDTGYFDNLGHSITTNASYDWFNGVIANSDYWNDTHVAFQFNDATGVCTLDWDYGQVAAFEMTYSASGYAESFADISDWDLTGIEGGDTFTSDGDVATIDTDSTAGSDYVWTNSLSLDATPRYIELRYKMVGTATYARIYYWTGDDKGGTNSFDVLTHSTTWITKKFYTTQAIECIELTIYKAAATDYNIFADYLRVSPSNETGLQHDGSTVEGVNEIGAGLSYAISTDTDILTMNVTYDTSPNTGQFQFPFDTTSTAIDIERDYYPFWKVRVKATQTGTTNPRWGVRLDGYRSDAISITSEWATYYLNTKAFVAVNANKYFYLAADIGSGESCKFEMDYTKAYSIADYTVTQSSTTTNDYLYVEDSILISNMESGSITLDYDPTFLLNGSYSWIKSTSLGTSYLSFYRGWWSQYSSDTTGSFVMKTITDYRIMFNASANIIDIQYFITPPQWHSFTMEPIYFDMPNWHMFTMEDIVFYIPINELNISYLLMLGGLVMIPTSTVLLVKGGRSDMSRDKLFLFLIMFLFGWAFVLGGLM